MTTAPLPNRQTAGMSTPAEVLIPTIAALQQLGGVDSLPVSILGDLHAAVVRYAGELGSFRFEVLDAWAAAQPPTDSEVADLAVTDLDQVEVDWLNGPDLEDHPWNAWLPDEASMREAQRAADDCDPDAEVAVAVNWAGAAA